MSKERDGLFEFAASVVGNTARIGLTIASAPLVLLPSNSRRRVRRAMAEVARAVVVFPKELAAVSERVVDEAFSGNGSMPSMPSVTLPNPAEIGDRAREFTQRLGKAAEELTTSFSRVAGEVADQVEKSAAKVDEWVDKPAAKAE
jgi:hypothetical protein